MYGGTNEEDIREVVELGFRDIRLLEYITMKPKVPALIGPVAISSVVVSELTYSFS